MNTVRNSIIPNQIDLFEKDAELWWKAGGSFDLLHHMTSLRVEFIKAFAPCLKGLSILDIGCGGGILCEPLSRLGAKVIGIDASPSAIEAAKAHQKTMRLDAIDYHHTTLEDFANLCEKQHIFFDLIIASEIIEHINDPKSFLHHGLSLLKPDGIGLYLSTINQTWQSFVGAILGAEYLLKWVPRGTHEWKRFLKPSDIDDLLPTFTNGTKEFSWSSLKGMTLNPFTKEWTFTDDLSINYMGMIQHVSRI